MERGLGIEERRQERVSDDFHNQPRFRRDEDLAAVRLRVEVMSELHRGQECHLHRNIECVDRIGFSFHLEGCRCIASRHHKQ